MTHVGGLSNREHKEYLKLKRKSDCATLNNQEKTRLVKLENLMNNEHAAHSSYVAKEPTQKYNLAKFTPKGKQVALVNAIERYDAVFVQGASGVGKTSAVVWKSLGLLGKDYQKIVFIKNPTEAGDSQIGFLKGEKEDKLEPHFQAMRGVFYNFMSKEKLSSDEKNGNIVFSIPNFMLGATLSNAIVIIDEAQVMSPLTLKLLMERVDDTCKLIVLGDKAQRYSVKKLEDGFTNFINMITDVDDDGVTRYSVEPLFAYIDIPASENRRGAISKRVTELYAQ